MRVFFHVTERKNLPAIFREGLVPRCGPRSMQLGEPCDGVFLFTDLDSLADGVCNWLGEEFPEEAELVALEVRVPDRFRVEETAGWERVVYSTIPPAGLRVLSLRL